MEFQRLKKKLTADERFAYRLCLALGEFPHPDYLLAYLTWEQFSGWRNYHSVEPWGEMRADQRAQVQVMWMKAPVQFPTDDLPELTYPYSGQDLTELLAQKATLDQRVKELREKRKAKVQRPLETLAGEVTSGAE